VKTYARCARCHHSGFCDGDPRRRDLCGVRKEIQTIVDRHGRPTAGVPNQVVFVCRAGKCSLLAKPVAIAGRCGGEKHA